MIKGSDQFSYSLSQIFPAHFRIQARKYAGQILLIVSASGQFRIGVRKRVRGIDSAGNKSRIQIFRTSGTGREALMGTSIAVVKVSYRLIAGLSVNLG
jgi:hypothetical protein